MPEPVDDVYDPDQPDRRDPDGIHVTIPGPEDFAAVSRRVSLFFGGFLVLLGGLVLLGNVLPLLGVAPLAWGQLWPAVFIVLSLMFFLPPFIFPAARAGLAGLYIPGAIVLVLGLIFQYQVLTRDWLSWAYAWLLIPGSVGLGLMLGAWVGKWGKGASITGAVMFGIFLGLFGLFATFLAQSTVLRIAGPIMLIVLGVLQLIRSLRRN